MSTAAALNANLAFEAQGLLGIGQQFKRAIDGDKNKVSIIVNNICLVQFDAVINESYSQDANPTGFPIETGATISDHIIVAPRALDISGIISDSPVDDRKALITEGITTAIARLTGPLGVVVAATAFASAKALTGSKSASRTALNTLMRLAGGDQDSATPTGPIPFTVVTRLKRYDNMVIRSFQVPRDASTGNALVFNLSMIQVRLVTPQKTVISLQKIPEVSQEKESEKKGKMVGVKEASEGYNTALTGFREKVAPVNSVVKSLTGLAK